MQTTSTILMIRPVSFGFNEQTSTSNLFQQKGILQEGIQQKALAEFDAMVDMLLSHEVNVIVIPDTEIPHTPDSIFPNNWISTHRDGSIFLYPMEAENRRQERRVDLLDFLKLKYEVREIIDLSGYEKDHKYLEGTGSMVLDRLNKIVYACISSRTDGVVLDEFCKISGYSKISFHAYDQEGHSIYHTNVLMCLGSKFCVICLASIIDESERGMVVDSLSNSGKEIIDISFSQMNGFAGNMLEVINAKGNSVLVMSSQAFGMLTDSQVTILEKYTELVHSSLNTIESNGGGSARCMMAEIFLPAKN